MYTGVVTPVPVIVVKILTRIVRVRLTVVSAVSVVGTPLKGRREGGGRPDPENGAATVCGNE